MLYSKGTLSTRHKSRGAPSLLLQLEGNPKFLTTTREKSQAPSHNLSESPSPLMQLKWNTEFPAAPQKEPRVPHLNSR